MSATLFQEHQQKVVGFIRDLPLPQAVKDRLLDEQLLEKQQFLFSPFALAFAGCFPGVSKAQHLLTNAATYLGARSVYTMDGVFDLQTVGPAIQKPLMYGQLYLQESQRLLGKLFPEEGPFWQRYYQRYWDHFKELEESRQIEKALDFEGYRQLLAYKYALLFVPVDILHHLSGEKNTAAYETIQESLHWFIVGYNLPNEVKGLEDDLRTGVNNYAWWRLKATMEQLDMNPADFDPAATHKLLYATGVAAQLLDESLEAFQKAREVIASLDVPVYSKIIEHREKRNTAMKEHMLGYMAEMG